MCGGQADIGGGNFTAADALDLTLKAASAAIDETAILLHPPSMFIRRFNVAGESASVD